MMRLPGAAIAGAFAAGSALGLYQPLLALSTIPAIFRLALRLAAVLISLSLFLLRGNLPVAGASSLAAWLLLGASPA
jgi:hypothetical protein